MWLSCFILYYHKVPLQLKKFCELKNKGHVLQSFFFRHEGLDVNFLKTKELERQTVWYLLPNLNKDIEKSDHISSGGKKKGNMYKKASNLTYLSSNIGISTLILFQ